MIVNSNKWKIVTLIKFLSQTTSLGVEVEVKRNHRDAISLYYNHFSSTHDSFPSTYKWHEEKEKEQEEGEVKHISETKSLLF